MANPRKIITLLTDFGTRDPYVATMKGVIYRIVPDAVVVDITHEIQPGNIQQASFVLSYASAYFPEGTIHVSVIDPGVGTSRRGLIVQTDTAFFILPDNGLISQVVRKTLPRQIIHLTNPSFWLNPVSNTFHGRDIFAPVSAHLANEIPAIQMGVQVKDVNIIPCSVPDMKSDGSIEGEVMYIDRFGNCITNISKDYISETRKWVIKICGRTIDRIVTTYGMAEDGEFVALVGSTGYLEIAIRNCNASLKLGISIGDKVLLKPTES